MGRNIGGTALGYVVMGVVVFGGMSLAWAIMGDAGAFEPGSWEVSMIWGIVSVAIGLIAATAGGYVCARIGKDRTAVYMLIGLVVVLGVWAAIPDAVLVEGARPDGISMWEAMGSARPPAWVRWTNPIIGVVGVLLGASKVK